MAKVWGLGPEPPVPLILAGWAFSSDRDKQRQWAATVKWAEEHGCSQLIPSLDEDEQYCVPYVSDYRYSPGWFDHSPKQRPDEKEVDDALGKLKANWAEIAGSELAAHTRPECFTGKKRRRLVVSADPGYKPLWGSWRSATELPSAFSRFRSAVNEAIRPLEMDHIDFDCMTWMSDGNS